MVVAGAINTCKNNKNRKKYYEKKCLHNSINVVYCKAFFDIKISRNYDFYSDRF